MKSSSKVLWLAIFFSAISLNVFSQSYQVNSVVYEITGQTREYPLKEAVEIDTAKIHPNLDQFELYLDDLHTQFLNQRVLESVEIIPTYGIESSENIIPVDLLVKTTDSFNFIAAPYPKYDSNSGFEFKIDSKNYNFLGSMQTLDAEIYYEYDLKDPDDPNDKNEHSFGGSVSFSYPFQLSVFDASWSNSLGLSYTVGNDTPNASLSTGLSLSYPINNVIGLSFSVTQGLYYNRDYYDYGDAFYFSESASFAVPITLAKTEHLGNLTWTPSINTTYYWDFDGINKTNEDLYDTDINFGHSFSIGRVDWIGNYKNGFQLSMSQNLTQPLLDNKFSISESLEFKYFKAFKYLGFKSRTYLFSVQNSTSEMGDRVRGVRNSYIDTKSLLAINLDFPIKVWQTDWVRYGLWDWTRYLDFEMQISPFVDIALGYNPNTKSDFSIKDGWYGAGIEVLGYLNAARSVVGRISGGVDIVQFADKVGNRVGFVETVVDKLFNTGWRGGSWYEFTFGIGLFY